MKRCYHPKSKLELGPRIPARWGSWATLVCTVCKAWRAIQYGKVHWRKDSLKAVIKEAENDE